MDIERAKASLKVAVLLTLTGGFLDSFTFLGHGKLFANSMTGNIVLLSANMADGNWHQAARYLSPLAGFTCAVAAAHLMQWIAPRWARHHAIASLLFEIAFLLTASLTALPEFWLIPGISFVATLQTVFFTHYGKVAYTSVMTTTNLRRCMQLFWESTLPRLDIAGLRDAAVLGVISISFAIGAVIGGLVTPRLHDAGLCVPATLLFIALLDICRGLLRGASPALSSTTSRPDGPISTP